MPLLVATNNYNQLVKSLYYFIKNNRPDYILYELRIEDNIMSLYKVERDPEKQEELIYKLFESKLSKHEKIILIVKDLTLYSAKLQYEFSRGAGDWALYDMGIAPSNHHPSIIKFNSTDNFFDEYFVKAILHINKDDVIENFEQDILKYVKNIYLNI